MMPRRCSRLLEGVAVMILLAAGCADDGPASRTSDGVARETDAPVGPADAGPSNDDGSAPGVDARAMADAARAGASDLQTADVGADAGLPGADAATKDAADHDLTGALADVVIPRPDGEPSASDAAPIPPDDGALRADTSPLPQDGGATASDAGALPHDGGAGPPDAGAAAPDGGTGTADASPLPPDAEAALACQAPAPPGPPGNAPSVVISNGCTVAGGYFESPRIVPRSLVAPRVRGEHRALDFDGDGDTDVVSGHGSDLAFQANLGGGHFDLPQRLPAVDRDSQFVDAFDVDGDGRSDWVEWLPSTVFSEVDAGLYWHHNPGGGRISPAEPWLLGNVEPRLIADADVDGDRDVLLLVDGAPHWMENGGAGRFTLRAAEGWGPEHTLQGLEDLDGDAAPELLLADALDGRILLSGGLGGGRFGSPDAVWAFQPSRFGGLHVQFIDVDVDGRSDIFFGLPSERHTDWLPGLGGGRFSDLPNRLAETSDDRDRLIDLDADGDPDFVSISVAGRHWTVRENAGGGVFLPPNTVELSLEVEVLFDVDGDCHPDGLVEPTLGPFQMQSGDGHGAFEPRAEAPDYGEFDMVRPADIEGGGVLDLIARVRLEDFTRVPALFRQVRAGVFESSEVVVAGPPGRPFGVGNQNDDGRADLVLVLDDGRVALAPGLGDGRFGEPVAATPAVPGEDVFLADVDGDGLTDVVVAGGPEALAWYAAGRPDERRTFGGHPFRETASGEVLLVDMNGDGLPDLVTNMGLLPTGIALIIVHNLGGGQFEGPETVVVVSARLASHLSVGDLDADGDMDLLVLQDGLTWLRQTSPGRFEPKLLARLLRPIRIEDVDADGDADVIATDEVDHFVLRNRGDASFEPPWTLSWGAGGSFDAAHVVDLDGDGHRDLVAEDGLWVRGPLAVDEPRAELLRGVDGGGVVAMADLDRDGNLEFISGQSDETLVVGRVVPGEDLGVTQVVGAAGLEPVSLEAHDVTGDAAVDLLVFGAEGWCLLSNDGGGRLIEPCVPLAEGGLAHGDLNSDGVVELVFCGPETVPSAYVASGGAVAGPTRLAGLALDEVGDCALLDVDADGDPDLAMARPRQVALYENDGAGVFTLRRSFDSAFLRGPLRVVDVNVDGRPDLNAGRTDLLDNPGGFDGDWRQHRTSPMTTWQVDLDSDGVEELVESELGSLGFRRFDAETSWRWAGSIHRSLLEPVRPAFGDVDGDGLIDVLISEPGQPGLLLARQRPACAPAVTVSRE